MLKSQWNQQLVLRALSGVTASMLGISAASAAPEPFNPDRPTYADSPLTVPAGSFMVELGSELDFDGPPAQNLVGGTLRVGVASDLELRLALPNLYKIEVGDDSELALSNLGVGAKYHLPVTQLDLGLGATVYLPTATGLLDNDAVNVNVALNAGKRLTSVVSVGGNLGLALNQLGENQNESVFASGYGTFDIKEGFALFAQTGLSQPIDGDLGLGVGFGAYSVLAAGVQIDLGLDVGIAGGYRDLVLQMGTSIQF